MELILGALLIAVIFTLIVSFAVEGDRTWAGLAFFFLLFFLPIWALALWIPAVGPMWYGVAWLDFLAFALILLFFILAVTPNDYYRKRRGNQVMATRHDPDNGHTATMRSYSAAFWGFVAFILLAIIMGSMRTGF